MYISDFWVHLIMKVSFGACDIRRLCTLILSLTLQHYYVTKLIFYVIHSPQ